MPLLYRPKDTWRQNIMVTIAGPLLIGRRDQQELEVPLKYAREVLNSKWGQDWALGYALTVHSSQGLTVASPQKVWIIDDFLQWSNLAYLAVSRVKYLSQLERVVCLPHPPLLTGLLAMPSPFTRARVSQLPVPRKSGS